MNAPEIQKLNLPVNEFCRVDRHNTGGKKYFLLFFAFVFAE